MAEGILGKKDFAEQYGAGRASCQGVCASDLHIGCIHENASIRIERYRFRERNGDIIEVRAIVNGKRDPGGCAGPGPFFGHSLCLSFSCFFIQDIVVI